MKIVELLSEFKTWPLKALNLFYPNFWSIHLILEIRNSTYDRIFQFSIWMHFWSHQHWSEILRYWANFCFNPIKKKFILFPLANPFSTKWNPGTRILKMVIKTKIAWCILQLFFLLVRSIKKIIGVTEIHWVCRTSVLD